MIDSLTGIGTILMLHRVHPYEPHNIIYNENMKISPSELESIILKLKKRGVNFVSLDQIVHLTRNNDTKRKFVAFTLDDGYKDNLQYAYPIFEKYKIPFCIYVTNCFPNGTTNLWWYALEALVLQNDVLRLSKKKLVNKTVKQKNANFLKIRRKIIDEHFHDPIRFMEEVGQIQFDLECERRLKCLTWEDIKTLSQNNLVTIGSHTMNHYPLSKLNPQQMREEVLNSKKELEEKLGRPVSHFAFPFGSPKEAGKRELITSKEFGFKTVTTTRHGHIKVNHDLSQLNRIFLFPLENNGTTLNRVLYWNIKSFGALFKNAF